ncbi:site-specific integrase [Actinomadura litoris]|uniref:Tyrosine-type recombinase/integrase n=1 Tax=Actinomadura litoris TaxID=2678616 RepID=A0A7K1LAQ9_9ACTN|nr:tyrosine-type recombinase/integrase [Actinomadura litoris]MUN41504.1 tyrosine-type recombinase/integrase [Actinomadura litoris]
MAPKGTVYKRCGCKDPDTGKPLNGRCPGLAGRKHGTWTIDVHIDTTAKAGRRLKRGGYQTKTKGEAALDTIRDLIKLAADDDRSRRRIGDLIFTATKRGGALPTPTEIRRRLGVGAELAAPSTTVAEWLNEWFAGRLDLKRSTKNGYRHTIDKFLIPLLGDLPRDKLTVEHIVGMFDRIGEWNEEIVAARKEGRSYDLPDDVRQRKRFVGIATQHRILATLSSAYSDAVLRPGMLDWNPAKAVRLPPEKRDPRRVWGPEQVGQFIRATATDRLGLLYRIVLLRGLRRGEVCGLRWQDLDSDDGGAKIVQTILEIRGEIVADTPKSDAGERWVAFDAETVELIRGLRRARRRERFAAGQNWQEHDLMFCQEDGAPLRPSQVSASFQQHAALAGLPVITLHEGRHTAATLALESSLDIKIVSDQLGHSSTTITQNLYTHVRKVIHKEAAAQVVRILSGASTSAPASES